VPALVDEMKARERPNRRLLEGRNIDFGELLPESEQKLADPPEEKSESVSTSP
jgi:hypothetical protein